MTKPLSACLLSGLCLALGALAQQPAAPAGEPADRVLAVVDDDPILDSDVEQVIALGLVEKAPDEDDRALRRRVLDRLIEQRLQFHEIDQYGFAEVPVDEVESQLARVRAGFASRAAFEARLAKLGLDEQGLRQILARQVMVLIYVEERLGARVFIDLGEIQDYYDNVLTPELRGRHQAVPPLPEVREQIRAVLKEQRLNEEIESWTEELRQQADILDYFDSQHDELPPVVSTEEAPPPGG